LFLAHNQSLTKPQLAVLNEDYPKIKSIQTVSEVDNMMNFMISILNIKVSNEEEQSELENQMIMVLDLIRTKFGNLTIPEVREAFKMYVAREFEIKVFRLLDCVSVGEILTEYTNFRNESLRVYTDKKIKAQHKLPEITDSEKEEILKKGVNRVFKEYLETCETQDNTEYIFDYLIETGFIKNNNNPKVVEYYQSKLAEARESVKNELQNLMISDDEIVRKKAKSEFEEFKKDDVPKTIIRAKKIVLIDFFEKQKSESKTEIFQIT